MHWFYEPRFSAESELSLETKRHLTSLRIQESEAICVTNGKGEIWEVLVTEGAVTEIVSHNQLPRSGPAITLVQALAKSDRDELALQASVELGATRVVPWQAQRSIVRWDQKAQKNQERWQSIAIEAMKQSQRAYLPEVLPLATSKQLKFDGQVLVLDPRAHLTMDQMPYSDSFTLVVGPEGGISPEELELLDSKGCQRVRLGQGVLRASTAGPAAIAALQLLHGEFRS